MFFGVRHLLLIYIYILFRKTLKDKTLNISNGFYCKIWLWQSKLCPITDPLQQFYKNIEEPCHFFEAFHNNVQFEAVQMM